MLTSTLLIALSTAPLPVHAAGPPIFAQQAESPRASSTALSLDDWRALVDLACVDCHRGAKPSAGVDLSASLDDPAKASAVWHRAYEQVRTHAMPPDSSLDEAEREEWITGLLSALQLPGDDPGHATVRRLTRSQIRRVLRDLLGVDPPVDRFLPRDASAYGFDTTGDTLFVSPLDFENWYELVDVALEMVAREAPAIFDAGAPLEPQLEAFLLRAFRRPPTVDELSGRLWLIQSERSAGAAPEAAYLEGVRAALLSSAFLFRPESGAVSADSGLASARVDGYVQASRLSFFLWGTLPDEELLKSAACGDLQTTEGVIAAALRMLDDARASWLGEDFATQWLGVAALVDVTPDVRRFKGFNEGLRRSMRRETVAFFNDLVAVDRSVLECLDSDHAFLNARLARHYGIEGVEHSDVRRVAIADRRRGGVLGMASVLTATSYPLRTSPVQRGQWLLETLLASPAPPPPPNVGTLPEDDQAKGALTFRARLERHRRDPKCASCHARMDPYGLALEGFDGIGRVRESTPKGPLNTVVILPNGSEIDGVVELKAALALDPRRFVRALTDKLFTYATGRPPGLSDHEALEGVVDRAESQGYRVRALLSGIVSTAAFTHRRVPGAAPGPGEEVR